MKPSLSPVRPPAGKMDWRDRLAIQFGIGPAREVPGLMWVLALGGVVQSTGASFVWPLTVIYVHFTLGKTLVVAGSVLTLQAAMSLLGQLLGGPLFDRYGGKPLIVAGLTCAGIMLTVIGLVRIWPVYLAAVSLLGMSYGLIEPPTNALIAQIWPAGGRKGFNLVYVARNAGVALGTAAGGFVAAISFILSFLCNAAAALGYAALVLRKIPRELTRHEPVLDAPAGDPPEIIAGPPPAARAVSVRRSLGGLAAVSLGACLNWLAYTQWHAVISVYMRSIGYSLAAYSLLWTINGVVIVAGQPFVSLLVRRFLRSLRSQMAAGSLLFAAAFLLIRAWPVYHGFMLGMVVLTLGEMLVLPGLPAAVAGLAAPGALGLFQGLLGGAVAGGRMLGPLLGGRLYEDWTPLGVLAGAAAACALASVFYLGYERTWGAALQQQP